MLEKAMVGDVAQRGVGDNGCAAAGRTRMRRCKVCFSFLFFSSYSSSSFVLFFFFFFSVLALVWDFGRRGVGSTGRFLFFFLRGGATKTLGLGRGVAVGTMAVLDVWEWFGRWVIAYGYGP